MYEVAPPRVVPVSLGELHTCECESVARLVGVPEEEYPRCLKCAKPVRDALQMSAGMRLACLAWRLRNLYDA